MAAQGHAPAESVRIQSVDRAIDLLLAVAVAPPAGATAPALAQACGLNRATAWRLLKTLQIRGLVTVDAATGRYAIGPTAAEIGNAAGPDALIAVARPVLEQVCRAHRGDRVAGRARRGRAHLRRRGAPDRRADRQLAGPLGAAARHLDRQGAARVPAARRAAPGARRPADRLHRHHDHRPRRAGGRTGRHQSPRVRGVRRRAGVVAVRGVGAGARPDRAAAGGPEHLGAEGTGARGVCSPSWAPSSCRLRPRSVRRGWPAVSAADPPWPRPGRVRPNWTSGRRWIKDRVTGGR